MERLQKIKDKSILGENNLSTYKSEREKDIYKRWTEEFIGEDMRVNSPYIDTNVKSNVLEIQGDTIQGFADCVSSEDIVKAILSTGLDNSVKVNSDGTFTVTHADVTFKPSELPQDDWIKLKPNTKYSIQCWRDNGGSTLIYPTGAQGGKLTVRVVEGDIVLKDYPVDYDLNYVRSVGDWSEVDNAYIVEVLSHNKNLFSQITEYSYPETEIVNWGTFYASLNNSIYRLRMETKGNNTQAKFNILHPEFGIKTLEEMPIMKKGVTYTVSGNYTISGTEVNDTNLEFVSSNKQAVYYFKIINRGTQGSGDFSNTFIPKEDIYGASVHLSYGGSWAFNLELNNLMIEEGNIKTNYTPGISDKKQILLPCQLGNLPAQDFRSGYKDIAQYDSSKNKWIIKNKTKLVLKKTDEILNSDFKQIVYDVGDNIRIEISPHKFKKPEDEGILSASVSRFSGFIFGSNKPYSHRLEDWNGISFFIPKKDLNNYDLDNAIQAWRNRIGSMISYCYVTTSEKIIETEYTDVNPLTLDTYEDVTCITSSNRTVKPNLKATLGFAKIEPLTKPTNINLSLNGLNTIITWDEIPSAQKYRIFLDSILLAETEYSVFKTNSELNGNIIIQAYNYLEESEISDNLYVKTIPNTPANLSVNSSTGIDGYEFNVNFMDYSEIENNYRVEYIVDDSLVNSIQIEDNGDNNVEIRCNFKVNDIKEKIIIKVIACNDIGENNLLEPTTLYISPDFRWTYKKESNQILVSWVDNNEYESAYLVRYSINGGENRFNLIEGYGGNIGETINHYIPLDRESNIEVSICCIINEKEHIFNKSVKASMDLDKSLIPLTDFKYSWIAKGVLKFSWIDNNTCEDGFEFVYKLNDTSEKTIFIDSNSKLETGDIYTYTHTLKEMDGISAKVRTRWDLGNSDYTDLISAVFIPVSGLPPSYIKKGRSGNGIIIEWEAQEYVESYEIHYNQEGKDKIIKTNNNIENIPIDYNIPSLIEVFIKTNFVGGVISDKTKSLIWTPSISTNIINGSIYNKTQDTYSLHSSCVYKIHDKYDIHSSTINKMLQKYFVETVNVTKFLLAQFPHETIIYTKDSKNSFENHVSISNIGIKNSASIDTVTYTKTVNESIIGTNIFTKLKESYPIETEINQIRIVCFGDSITSGHPGFWAESGTGDPQHCYEYWLDRRLKKAYEVINKGYGSDTTDMMLARFDKDVLPWNAQFCIIQGGTNDIYWAMAEADGNQIELDKKLELMKSNIVEMIKRCFDNKIIPVIGTLIPRTGAIGIYKTALYDFNQWIKDYCNSKDIYYIDWFNAGKKNIPPTPLEDPKNSGALNPIYDGDAVYDEYGNIIKQGRGIHPNKQGYKIMGDEIPLSIFRTYETGLKLYLDRDCLIEEKYNNDDKLNPYYTINVNDLRLSKTKTLIRYVKNTGVNQSVFSLYVARKHNATVEFIDINNDKFEYANGLLHSGKIQLVKINITALTDDNISNVDFYLAGRELKFN